jgi:hypothetical protein
MLVPITPPPMITTSAVLTAESVARPRAACYKAATPKIDHSPEVREK